MFQKLIKRYFWPLATLIGGLAHAQVTTRVTPAGLLQEFRIPTPQVSTLAMGPGVFDALTLPQEAIPVRIQGIHYEVGAPQIPVIRFYAYGPVEVQMTSKPTSSELSRPIVPAQESRVKIRGAQTDFQMNSRRYKEQRIYPQAEAYKVEQAGSIRGQTRYLVTLYPFQLKPGSNELIYNSNFTVKSGLAKPESKTQKTYALVVGQKFISSPSLQAFANTKKALGYQVEWISVAGNIHTSAAIRSELQRLLAEKNLTHALLVGDIQDVPAYDQASIYGASDHYYRAIDTADYNTDINGPDIGLGRVSARSEEELKGILEKFEAYQGLQSLNQWRRQATFLATDDQWELAEGTHNYVIDNHTSPSGYEGFFPENLMLGGDRLYAITHRVPNNIVQAALQAGRSIINYSGHGAKTFWDAPRVTQADVRSIPANQALPFVISNACITGDFSVDESFAETWQRHPNGAIMFWGSVDNTYWDEDDILEKRMFDGIFQHEKSTFAEITDHALSEHWRHYGGAGRSAYYWETYTVFGDPSLTLLTNK